MEELKKRKQLELDRYVEEHNRSIERMEEDFKKELERLQEKIKELTKENTKNQLKVNKQNQEQMSELEVLKMKHQKEREKKEAELRKDETEHLEEIRKILAELEMVKDEMKADKKGISVAMRDEEVIASINNQLFEVNKLWLLVFEEMDPIISMRDVNDQTKGAFEVFMTILSDLQERKREMNEHCEKKCAVAVRKNGHRMESATCTKILNILEKIGKPFECLEGLIKQSKNRQFPDTKMLEAEVNTIAKLVRELDEIGLTSRRTVNAILDRSRVAIAN